MTSVKPSSSACAASKHSVERVCVRDLVAAGTLSMPPRDGPVLEAIFFGQMTNTTEALRHHELSNSLLSRDFPHAGRTDLHLVLWIQHGLTGSAAEAGVIGPPPNKRMRIQ